MTDSADTLAVIRATTSGGTSRSTPRADRRRRRGVRVTNSRLGTRQTLYSRQIKTINRLNPSGISTENQAFSNISELIHANQGIQTTTGDTEGAEDRDEEQSNYSVKVDDRFSELGTTLPKIRGVSNNGVSFGIFFETPPLNRCSPVAVDNFQTGSSSVLHPLNLDLNLPPVLDADKLAGFEGKMVSSSNSQSLMVYRSVPPRPLSYTLTDVLESRASKLRSKTAPVSGNTPEEYAQRFKSRPITRPKVIDFDGSVVAEGSHATSQGFPTARARIYIGHKNKEIVDTTDVSSCNRELSLFY